MTPKLPTRSAGPSSVQHSGWHHVHKLSQTIREAFEATHRDEARADEAQEELTAVAQVNLLNRQEVSLVLLLAHT